VTATRVRTTVGLLVIAVAAARGVSVPAHMFLTAHMIQHVLLLQVGPLLVVSGMSRPRGSTASRSWSPLHAALFWIVGVAAMTLWYLPPAFAWMVGTEGHHAMAKATLVAAGLLFWRPVFAPRSRSHLEPGLAIAYMFIACVASTLSGASIAFAAHDVFGDHAASMLDQQVAGLVMWVPCCLVYVVATMAMLARWYGGTSDDRTMARSEA
jgi:cytochrome c oxidase assembly factor CtaG